MKLHRNWQYGSLQLLVLVTLCMLTFAFTDNYERYEYYGHNIIKNDGYKSKVECWNAICPDAYIEMRNDMRLHSEHGMEILSVRQVVNNLSNYNKLKISAKFKTEDVVIGDQPWQIAHLVIIGLDANGNKLFNEPHLLVKQGGTHGWHEFSKFIQLNKNFKKLLIEAQLSKAKGTVWVKEVSLQPVSEKQNYRTYRLVAIGVWIIFMAWILGTYVNNTQINVHRILTIVFVLMMVIAGVVPGNIAEYLNILISEMFSLSAQNFLVLSDYHLIQIDKLEHFFSFAILTSIVCWGTVSVRFCVNKVMYLGVFSIFLEFLQLLADDRNIELMDLIYDISGIVFVLVMKMFYYRFICTHKL